MNYIIISLALASSVFADSLTKEISETAQLRQEVEILSLEIENLKKSQQSQIDVYIQRDQEISAQIMKENFRSEQYLTQIKLGQTKLGDPKNLRHRGAVSWLKSFWEEYVTSLKTVHPLSFTKLNERIQKIKLDFELQKIGYEHALLQTWFVLESDLNKAQDAEFILSPLQIGDQLLHVEMVRLGRTKGYFRTAEGKYGHLSYVKKWELEYYDDKKSHQMIETLLSQFKQQQKTGLYQLPGIKL